MNLKNTIRDYRKMVFGALLALQTFGLSAQHISETYVLNWSATIYSTNSAGRITTRTFSSQDVIRKICQDNGVAYSSQYTLVYRPDKRDTVVIKIGDPAPPHQTFPPADYVSFEFYYTDFP